ncbi:MAG TPA: 30S ribosomal protein S11 [Anaerolineae bacterium]|nr:30S ribosomal protein S11 [Anaerolineae bacterium]
MGPIRRGRRTPRRERRHVPHGRVYVQSTFNNTIITFTDQSGDVICWRSAGQNFRGSRKSTPYAAQIATEGASRAAMDMGMREVDVFVKGPGPGREAALRTIQATGLRVRSITDVTPIPHNGCRPPKKRRI